MDYQAHNFTCYTVPECATDIDEDIDDDQTTLDNCSSCGSCHSQSTSSTSSDINLLRQRQRQPQQQHRRQRMPPFAEQRFSMPTKTSMTQIGTFYDANRTQPPQWGYFVPLASNCFFSPQLLRRYLRDNSKENDRSRRSISYSGSTMTNSLPRAAPRRISLMKDPPPPPPPKPSLLCQTTMTTKTATTSVQSSSTSSPIPSKFPQTEYNLIEKLDSSSSNGGGGGGGGSSSTLTAMSTSSISHIPTPTPSLQQQNLYQNHQSIMNYSSLLCHTRSDGGGSGGGSSSITSPAAVRKREKLLHRFSDAATLGRKLKKKKNTNRTCHSMTEAIEMLADPVIEDEFFGDRTTWEYHTVSVTRVPGYGFGIAVSGGRDNPHFANGDPSIAVSDVLKGGPAEDRLQVNDRIISVNGISLENVEYATAVQVLRDSGNTVTLMVKRRVPLSASTQHQHSHSMSSVGLSAMTNGNGNIGLPGGGSNGPVSGAGVVGLPLMSGQQNPQMSSIVNNQTNVVANQPIKVTLTKSNKKDDFGIVLGCRLFVKEISSKARDQLAANGYALQEGDTITRIHNTNCGDTMSLKEAKKIIDGCKERLNMVVLRDITNQAVVGGSLANATTTTGGAGGGNQLNNSTASNQTSLYSHTQQVSNCSNNLDDPYMSGGGASYSSQNLYVQPPTRSTNAPTSGNGLMSDEKSNLTPRGRSRGPLLDGVSLSQLDRPVTPPNGPSSRSRSDEPPRPPPPRGSSVGNTLGSTPAGGGGGVGANEDFYSSRRQLYEDDPLQRSRQSAEPRFISFQKEGSVGIRLTGGNEAGIFVTAVQPGSPASLQGLTPGDKILKVNDMDMHGVTREEAVLFLLSLQDRIDLIVQYCKEEYEEVVANQRGDSFHIKTHFHCENPSKGEMAFKAGDVFRVIDTLHNGVVGSWQVLKIGRGHQEMQRGVIPNKSRAEELATAQFNATKKEMNASESRGNFFRRRRSTHRRSKSLSRENWDDVVFSDSISKFPAYERVVLRHPGFVRPVVLFGPVSDISREKLTKDFPDKFTAPLQDDDKSNSKCRIVRLSNIRDIMDRGKHALLDITPNAVDRLNYAQFYPIVIFLKTDNKHVIKQLRHGLPKSAHKSSKKLLDQCQKLDRVWSHIFSTQIILNDTEAWYRKLREAIDLQQSGAVWMSETKPVESLSDDFLFPMTTSRLSYASSPESDLELSPGPSASLSLGNLPQLVKSSSDPSIATNQDNLDRDRDIIGEGLPPPYTNPHENLNNPPSNRRQTLDTSKYSYPSGGVGVGINHSSSIIGQSEQISSSLRPQSLYGINAPDLPPRIDRQSKPGPGEMLPPSRTNSSGGGTIGRSAQERLFGKAIVTDDVQAEYVSRNTIESAMERAAQTSLDRQQRMNASGIINIPAVANKTSAIPSQQNGSYDSVSSYDSYNTTQVSMQNIGRLGPNAPDDLKSVPSANNGRQLPPAGLSANAPEYARTMHDHHTRNFMGANDLNRQNSPGRPQYHELSSSRNIDPRNAIAGVSQQRPSNLGLESSPRKQILETKTDYGKYSRNNSASQADYSKIPKNPHMIVPPPNVNGNGTPNGNGGPFKPVPPPKPKNYRPPIQGGGGQWENGEPATPRSPNGFFYPPSQSHYHHAQQTPGSPRNGSIQPPYGSSIGGSNGGHYGVQQPATYQSTNGYNGNNHHYSGSGGIGGGGSGSSGGIYMQHRAHPAGMANLPPHTPERHPLDLAGSREQRGSAFELYRKPQIGTAGHHHNMSEMEPYDERYDNFYRISQYPARGAYVDSNKIPHRQRQMHNDINSYNQQREQHYQQQQQQQQKYQQFYLTDEACSPPPPPLPPPKTKRKSVLKSPLAAIKNAIIKTTRPLRRMNSVVEPERKLKPCIRRQHSMMERGMGPLCYPDEYPTYPGHEQPRYHRRSGSVPSPQMMRNQFQYQQEQQRFLPSHEILNNTYQNLETEDIYGNIGHYSRNDIGRHYRQQNDYDNLYANRALIDLERRQAEINAASGRNSRRIVRRHSTTTADRISAVGSSNGGAGIGAGHARRQMIMLSSPGGGSGGGRNYDQDEIYQSRHGAYMLDAQRRAPNSEIMSRRPFYPTGGSGGGGADQTPTEPFHHSAVRREMHRNHLYQSKKEMQERIALGKREMEREFSPPSSSSQSERDDKSDRDPIYQSRREIKESAMKTHSQLRDQIYQTRREAMESMAEPIYVSKREAMATTMATTRPEPIYESKEECILQSRENETDERKEEKTEFAGECCGGDIPSEEDTLSNSKNSDFQKSTETIIENTMVMANKPEPTERRAPLVCSEVDDDDEDDESSQDANTTKESSSNLSEIDDVFQDSTSKTLLVEGPLLQSVEPPKPTKAISPQKIRSPLHLAANILNRSGNVPQKVISTNVNVSRTSLETQYTSQGSILPIGPPNATSTPYTSNMSLPMAGPVSTATANDPTITPPNLFPMTPRESKTTKGIFDSKGGTLSDSTWNVSLQIPPGAIPLGVNQEIYFTVSDPRMGETIGGPPLDMENGETMLSPLVMCGPQGLEFLVPVTLNIPHCAGRTASLGLALKATDSEKNLHTEWDNIDLPSNAAAHTVSVKVDHF